MALYAFNGTWNKDEPNPDKDTNVIKFVEIFKRSTNPENRSHDDPELLDGVGTRFSVFGKMAGGITGAGGQERIREMYAEACKNYETDKVIDVIGFSRGAALAVHFCHVLEKEGLKLASGEVVKPRIRFLGLWDIVGSFGIPINFIIPFQKINLGYDFSLPQNADNVYHAMARDELRQTFRVNRLDPRHQHPQVEELWFRGVHSDVGGGNDKTVALASIALKWMLERAIDSGLAIDPNEISALDVKIDATIPIGENTDLIKNKPRKIWPGDELHESALGKEIQPGESVEFRVDSQDLYSWSGVRVVEDGEYAFSFPPGPDWHDAQVNCGPGGWDPDGQDFSFFKEKFFKLMNNSKRHNDAKWFEVIATVDESDDHMVRIGDGSKTEDNPWHCPKSGGLHAFANDARLFYGNNEGSMQVTVKRVG